MKKIVKVKDHEGLIVDTKTGAILNVDKTAIHKHHKKIRELEKEKKKTKSDIYGEDRKGGWFGSNLLRK